MDKQIPERKEVTTDELTRLPSQGPLQSLTFIDKDQESKHWLLLRKEDSRSKYYNLYNTASESDEEIELSQLSLTFFSKFLSSKKSRRYTFLGVAIHSKYF